jgi:hypothetical protein
MGNERLPPSNLKTAAGWIFHHSEQRNELNQHFISQRSTHETPLQRNFAIPVNILISGYDLQGREIQSQGGSRLMGDPLGMGDQGRFQSHGRPTSANSQDF